MEEIDSGSGEDDSTTTSSTTTTTTTPTTTATSVSTTTTTASTTSPPPVNVSDPVDCSSANVSSDDPLKRLYCNLTGTARGAPTSSFHVSMVAEVVLNATTGAKTGKLSYLQVYEVSVILDMVSKGKGVKGNMTSGVSLLPSAVL